MKHIYVVNPKAGGEDASGYVAERLKDIDAETEMYVTREPRDATRFVASRLAANDGEALRFYACGGDGTLNEVVSGVMVSGRGAEVGCYPC
ncbi:MAG: acylglycerol kinase family protein, partial [Bacteroidales bacterium]|nr:acylglycerol kinase family protein [Bacteroidales bacterium]